MRTLAADGGEYTSAAESAEPEAVATPAGLTAGAAAVGRGAGAAAAVCVRYGKPPSSSSAAWVTPLAAPFRWPLRQMAASCGGAGGCGSRRADAPAPGEDATVLR